MGRILVAEDDGLVADVVLTMLRSGGYEVVLARNGDEAVRIFGEQQFDLVLCDVHMPGKDGLEVAEETRRSAPDMPIVSMTGSYPRDTGGAHLDPAFLNATKRSAPRGCLLSLSGHTNSSRSCKIALARPARQRVRCLRENPDAGRVASRYNHGAS